MVVTKPSERNSGFTILELLVVVAIIGLLAAVALGSTSQIRKKGRDTKQIADAKTVNEAIAFFQNDNGDYPSKKNVFSSLLTVYVTSNNAARATILRAALSPYIMNENSIDEVLPLTNGSEVAWTYIATPPEYLEAFGESGALCLQLFDGYYFSVPIEDSNNLYAKTDGGKSNFLYEIITGPYQLDPCAGGFGFF